MKKFLLLVIIVSFITGCRERVNTGSLPSVASGTIERIENFESMYVTSRNVDIWLPEGYNTLEKYPVLYMHDGQMLFDSTTTWNKQEWGVDEVLGKLIASGQIEKVIVVGIFNSGAKRFAEYFPQRAFEMIPQVFRDSLAAEMKKSDNTVTTENLVISDNYLQFLVKELKPVIDERYSTTTDADHTFIGGSSMGGLISIYAICEYPGVFGGAACLSTHWSGSAAGINDPVPGNIIRYLDENLPDPASHRIYFDYGTETLDSLYEPYQARVDEIMRIHGFDETSWKTLRFEGDDHSENSWRNRLHIPVTFLLGK